jgi:hypothetical protein
MKRIVTHMLVATGLVIGAVGVAQAHTDLNIGLSLGAPAYAAPAPVYVRPAPPVYRAPYWHHDEPRGRADYRHDYGQWNRASWNHGPDHNNWGHRG